MKQLRILGFFLALLVMASCNKSDDEATGTGDVMIVSKRSGANVLYGLSINAYTLSSFSTVSVVGSADPARVYNLKANQGYKTSFLYETPANEMTTSKPAVSTYTFSATFENGVTQQFDDVLLDEALLPSTIDTLKYDAVKKLFRITWSAVTGADSYIVEIMDGATQVLKTRELENTVKAITVNPQPQSAEAGFKPVNGKTYYIRVYAYLYESAISVYNFQALSIVERSIVWGE